MEQSYSFRDFNNENGFFNQIINYINYICTKYKLFKKIGHTEKNKKKIYKIIYIIECKLAHNK